MIRRGNRNATHPVVPSVNLLSPWVFEALETRRLRRRFVVAGAVLALVIGAGWAVQELRVRQAEQLLTVEQAETSRLTAQTQELAPVRVFVTTVEAQKGTVQEAMQHEVLSSRVLADLQRATPAGLTLESLSVTVTPPVPTPDAAGAAGTESAASGTPAPAPAPVPGQPATGTTCPGPDPFHTRVVVGCLVLSGTADSRATVGDFVVNLGGERLFVEPFIDTTTTAEGDEVLFSGSVGLSEAAFSKRYADMEKLLHGEVSR